jgi:hypothetical protein
MKEVFNYQNKSWILKHILYKINLNSSGDDYDGYIFKISEEEFESFKESWKLEALKERLFNNLPPKMIHSSYDGLKKEILSIFKEIENEGPFFSMKFKCYKCLNYFSILLENMTTQAQICPFCNHSQYIFVGYEKQDKKEIIN